MMVVGSPVGTPYVMFSLHDPLKGSRNAGFLQWALDFHFLSPAMNCDRLKYFKIFLNPIKNDNHPIFVSRDYFSMLTISIIHFGFKVSTKYFLIFPCHPPNSRV